MSRKNKLSPDPRGKIWSEDSTKFGQQMLEKMGWSKGKGLGRNEDGLVEHVKVPFKDNKKGVGYTLDHDNNWIAHQEDFNSLLTSLQEHHSSAAANQNKPIRLEECSKKSRSRVHYHKFTRGKDLSRYSQEDLACIIGSQNKKVDKDESVDTSEPAHNINTINSPCNMNDYFAKKLARLKSLANNKTVSSYEKEDSYDEEETSNSKRMENDIDNLNNDSEITFENSSNQLKVKERKCKKKKKKHKQKNLVENDMQLVSPSEIDECKNEKRKKKKRKYLDNSLDSKFIQNS